MSGAKFDTYEPGTLNWDESFEPSPPPPRVAGAVRAAEGGGRTAPPANYVGDDAATAPDVDGPRMATTLLSPTYFCARACAGVAPCSTGVSPPTSLIFRPRPGASV